MSEKTHAELIAEMRKTKYGDEECQVKWCLTPWADRLEAAYSRDLGALSKLYDILSSPDLERPDGTPCYCNPDVPNRMEDFGTSSDYGVCDGESKEVFNESIADALSAVARAQMLLGIADYKRRTIVMSEQTKNEKTSCCRPLAAAPVATPLSPEPEKPRYTPKTFEAKFKEVVCTQLGVIAEQCYPEASFVDDLGIDSLDGVELIMAFEVEFGIHIPDEVADKLTTYGAAFEYVKKGLISNGTLTKEEGEGE